MISADHNLQVFIDVSQTTSSSSNNRVTTKKTSDQHDDHTLGRITDVPVLPGDRREPPGGEIVPEATQEIQSMRRMTLAGNYVARDVKDVIAGVKPSRSFSAESHEKSSSPGQYGSQSAGERLDTNVTLEREGIQEYIIGPIVQKSTEGFSQSSTSSDHATVTKSTGHSDSRYVAGGVLDATVHRGTEIVQESVTSQHVQASTQESRQSTQQTAPKSAESDVTASSNRATSTKSSGQYVAQVSEEPLQSTTPPSGESGQEPETRDIGRESGEETSQVPTEQVTQTGSLLNSTGLRLWQRATTYVRGPWGDGASVPVSAAEQGERVRPSGGETLSSSVKGESMPHAVQGTIFSSPKNAQMVSETVDEHDFSSREVVQSKTQQPATTEVTSAHITVAEPTQSGTERPSEALLSFEGGNVSGSKMQESTEGTTVDSEAVRSNTKNLDVMFSSTDTSGMRVQTGFLRDTTVVTKDNNLDVTSTAKTGPLDYSTPDEQERGIHTVETYGRVSNVRTVSTSATAQGNVEKDCKYV
jgi:hypothetical protein